VLGHVGVCKKKDKAVEGNPGPSLDEKARRRSACQGPLTAENRRTILRSYRKGLSEFFHVRCDRRSLYLRKFDRAVNSLVLRTSGQRKKGYVLLDALKLKFSVHERGIRCQKDCWILTL